MKPRETFSHRLRKLRKERKVSQKELATALHLSDVSVSRYELGTAEPSLETFHAICNYFNVTPDYLFGNTDNPSEIDKRPTVEEINTNMLQIAENAEKQMSLLELAADILDGKSTQKTDFATVIRLLDKLSADELSVIASVARLIMKPKIKNNIQDKEEQTHENN